MSQINWKAFPRTALYVPEENLTYYTWLERVQYLKADPFKTLSHFTTFENAEDIFITKLKAHRVNDHSCVSKGSHAENHPLFLQNILWVMPDIFETTQVEKYGNVRFYTKDLKFIKKMNYYLIEFIDNSMQPVARVLITTKVYPDLAQFSITKENDGPIYMNDQGKFFKYTSFKRNTWSHFEDLDIEIMLEHPDNFHTFVSYVKCLYPRSVVKNEKYIKKIKSFECQFGELHYAMFHFKHRSNTQYVINELDQCTQDSIQSIVTTQLTSQWYPIVTKQQGSSSNPNILVNNLKFDQTLYNRQIEWEDENVIEDLHFIYVTTGVMPDAYVMVKKVLESMEKMRYYRSFKEVFDLFIDHFKSKEAQIEVQNAFTKFIFFH